MVTPQVSSIKPPATPSAQHGLLLLLGGQSLGRPKLGPQLLEFCLNSRGVCAVVQLSLKLCHVSMGSVCLLLGSGSCSSTCCQAGSQLMHLKPRTAVSRRASAAKKHSVVASQCPGMRLGSYKNHICIRLAASGKNGLRYK